MKKLLAFMLSACLALGAFSLTACGDKDGELQKDAGITLNGKMTEQAYDAIPSRTAGIKGQLKAQFAADQNGLYVGLSVSDADMRYLGSVGDAGVEKVETDEENDAITEHADSITGSDYVGISIDVKANRDEVFGISSKTSLLRFDAAGRFTFSNGDEYGDWQLKTYGTGSVTGRSDMPKFSYRIDGVALGTDNSSEPIGNVGYYAEIFFSWSLLGTSADAINKNSTIMYCLEHRDYGVDVCTDAVVAAPSYYNSLTLLGDRKGSNMPVKAPEITIDGKMDEAVWQTATVTNQGNFGEKFEGETAGEYIAKAFFGKDGVYLGVNVVDPHLEATEATGGSYKNCGMEMRIYTYDADGVPLVAYKWLFDLFGPQWHESVESGLNSSFAPYAQYKYDIRGTINDNSDTDEGWGIEMYIPYSHLGITDPNGSYMKILHAVGSATQHNSLPAEYEEKNPDDWTVVADYVRVSKQ